MQHELRSSNSVVERGLLIISRSLTTTVTVAALLGAVFLGTGAGSMPTSAERAAGSSPLSADAARLVPLGGTLLPHLAAAKRQHSLSPTRSLGIEVTLRLRDQASFQQYLAGVYDRRSPLYHRFLTTRQFAEKFAPTTAQREQVMGWMRSKGLHVLDRFANGTFITACGTVKQIDDAFSTRLYSYRQHGHGFFANQLAVRLPAWLAFRVVAVSGLSNRDSLTHQVLRHESRLHDGGSGISGGFTPQDLSQLYDMDALHVRGITGKQVTVGIVAGGDILDSDLATYQRQYGLRAAIDRVAVRDPNGTKPLAPDSEAELDTEVVSAMAPDAHILLYTDSNPHLNSIAVTFNQMVSENRASVLSTSLDGPEADWSSDDVNALHQVFQEAAAQGQTVFAPTGDDGAYAYGSTDPSQATTLAVKYPGSDSYVTSVGGTNLTRNSDGSYGGESAWGDTSDPKNISGGGGGLSQIFPRPSYQTGPGTDNRYSNGQREVPDVSADGDPTSGYDVYLHDGNNGQPGWGTFGGTSASTPLWASFGALLVQDFQTRIGFLNPMLYALAQRASSFSRPAFHDVTQGNNLYYPATTGYDLATGLGSFDGAAMESDIHALGGFAPLIKASIGIVGITHPVNGKLAFTTQLHLGEANHFLVGYTVSGATPSATVRLWYNQHWFPPVRMSPIKLTNGSPAFRSIFYFRHTNQLGNWYARFTVVAGSKSVYKDLRFTVVQ